MKELWFCLLSFVLLVVVLGISSQANAYLYNRGTDSLGYQLIYDSDLDITWYDYSNTWDNGNWQNQMNWADGLSVNLGGTMYDDWRLPATFDTGCTGYHCTNSEMGYLFYTELGNRGYCDASGNCPQADWGLRNRGPFINLLSEAYWSGTTLPSTTAYAWTFDFWLGPQRIDVKDAGIDAGYGFSWYYAMAVRDGDIAVVPEPISSVLFFAGGSFLAGRLYIKRKEA